MNPVELAREIEERYRRYLKTLFFFKDPVLRKSFATALDSGHLSKGPFLEATPVFKRGKTLRILFRDLFDTEADDIFLRAAQGERPLYLHQEQAIQKVFEGNNVIVATGTGSGKTEAFLYPILLHLYKEFRARQLGPGVRALVLYPMNALANDQRERLGEICKRLEEKNSAFQFTFGQYIGETPDDEHDSKRHAREHIANRLPGELVLRSEMRETPPHILLTNYSMLEYLLLRPDDSPLFDDGQAKCWTFLVLDEAHQYRGSRGIEMAMLLRRLKQRLREGGRSEPFRCIATSATLIGKEGDKAAVASFASDLFGEKFNEEGVILGETEPIPQPGTKSLQLDDYKRLLDALNTHQLISDYRDKLADRLGVEAFDGEELLKFVGRLLQHDSRACHLRYLVVGKPAEVQELASQVFADLSNKDRVNALATLVDLLLQAKDPTSDAPLLSARYHLFLRSLEGAFVSYSPEEQVFLDRKSEEIAFEVALCRECGQHYFVGSKRPREKLEEAVRDPGNSEFGATFFRPIKDIGEQDEEEDSDSHAKQAFRLCVQCGQLAHDEPGCGHNTSILVVKEDSPKDEDRADQIEKCGACGYTAAGRDPVRELVHGADGPHAVIATTLHQNLPEPRKKVLAFADGRQEAAFFAWYLEDSYRDILSRNMILRIINNFPRAREPEGVSLSTLADAALRKYRDAFRNRESDDNPTIRKNIWRAFYREFLTQEKRISLEGVGLAQWSIKRPSWFRVPEVLTQHPWSLSEQRAWDLVAILLDSMRTDRAVELRTPDDVSLNWDDLDLQISQMSFQIGKPGKKNVRGWDGKRTKRTRFLTKLLMMRGLSESEATEQAVQTLRAIWDTIRDDDKRVSSPDDHLLISAGDARRLNPDWWRLHPITADDTLFQCDTCGQLQAICVDGVCPRPHCSGELKPIQAGALEPNHYRLLYQENLPSTLRVEEHTAQIDKEKARDFQREFKEGKIHVLSCSTTFELGVDLGDLDTIFLRNVPPEAFNYAQRVGRAGRRSGYPGFAITYCRRAPHDLYHFAEPGRMLSGQVRPPVLGMRNEKIIGRHVTAVALSAFFRKVPERFAAVENLFGDLEKPQGTEDLKRYLSEHQPELEENLRATVPADMLSQLGLDNGEWINKIVGDDSQFAAAEAEVSSDYRTVLLFEETARSNRQYKDADWAQKRAETIKGEEVLTFLSRKAVIPKYGFPVDVVELDLQRTQQNQEAFEVSLQRDLGIAISEFAPTSKLVANKKVWTSYGLKKVAEKEWPRRFYKRCAQHNLFLHWKPGDPEPPTTCDDRLTERKYIIPRFGFVTDRDKPKAPRARTTRVFTTRPYFAGSLGPTPGTISLPANSRSITIKKASPGLMVVLC